MTSADRILLRARARALEEEARFIREQLGTAANDEPIREKPGKRVARERGGSPRPVVAPDAEELSDVTDLDRERVERAARRHGGHT